jgi:hypothetical protein
MLPFLTATIGLEAANLFKIANDGALLIYRSIIKTIGTTDTTLLSYAITTHNNPLPNAFKHLLTTVITLCGLFTGIFVLCIIVATSLGVNTLTVHLFGILTISYLTEAVLSPFERLLEVKFHYWMLFLSYIPYIVGMILIASSISSLGLLTCVIIIQLLRISSSLLMTLWAVRTYPRVTER